MADQILRNKKIILGITGCIAAYKAAHLARMLKKAGADVWPVMTQHAQEFITPLTLRTLTGNPCITDMFDKANSLSPIPHISLSDNADLMIVAPATANIIAKASHGICDDILSTTLVSTSCKKLFAPAMNTKMWENNIVKDNVQQLTKMGFQFVYPANGELACGEFGDGRLADIDDIFQKIVALIGIKQDLAGKKILVTAGGTREPIDPVRFIGNRSSGKMGFFLAEAAASRGAEVTLINANVSVTSPVGVTVHNVKTAAEMKSQVENEFESSDIIIMSAAVADFRPKSVSGDKIKKSDSLQDIELEENEDILKSLGKNKGNKIIVGFSVESQDLISNSKKKLESKKLDMIIANDISAFECDDSSVSIILSSGPVKSLGRLHKKQAAQEILDSISGLS